jgi:hypothetical protein
VALDVAANFYRPLSEAERQLSRWMLENGTAEAPEFLKQLEVAEATHWRCPCGCASFNFKVKDMPAAPPGVHILGDFVFYDGENVAGIFIYSSNGILSGLEVTGLAGDAPKTLPEPRQLLTHEEYGRHALGKSRDR